jgi:NAD(P)-dependent dehydrogenase (short-subunit alcohol dehydrogenase family)
MRENRVLEGRTAFVTGANRGLGAALCRSLAARGCKVFAGLHGVPDARETPGDGIVRVPLDVTGRGSAEAAAELTAQKTQDLDILINNAGVLGDTESRLSGDIDYDDVLSAYNVNAVGPLRVINAFSRLLLAGETKIVVNISSEAGSVSGCTRDGWFAYCMSKAALNMLSAIVHNALRPGGGKVLNIHPGWMRTWMRGHLDSEASQSPEESAEGIVALIERAAGGDPAFTGKSPAFLDFRGEPLNW